MTYITISTLTCFSHTSDFDESMDIIDEFSQLKYDGESGEPILIHTVSFLGFCDRKEVPLADISYGLFFYTFKACIKQWHLKFPAPSIHSFKHMIRDLGRAFFCYDDKALHRKILKLKKAPNKSIVHSYDCFHHYYFEFPKDEVD